jgi:hypothetical protein
VKLTLSIQRLPWRSLVLVSASCLAGVVAIELILRLFLWAPFFSQTALGQKLREPGRFAHPLFDSSYWLLNRYWTQKFVPKPTQINPVLGWSQGPATPDNPMGLRRGELAALRDDRDKVFVYGDSFVGGHTLYSHTIPSLLNQTLPSSRFVNFSVQGYGLDQIYLMFHNTKQLARPKLILVGIFLDDMTRTALTFRNYQKPFFHLKDDQLAIDPAPIELDPHRFLKSASVGISSYALAALDQSVIRPLRTKLGFYGTRSQRVRRITKRLVDAFVEEASALSAPLLFVIFYDKAHVERRAVDRDALVEYLTRKGHAFVDTRPWVLDWARKNGFSPKALYDSTGHYGSAGNSLIASKLAEVLREKYGL